MPSLGFLKKKRTRDDKADPSSSQPNSPVTPVTPTISHSFESQHTQSTARTTPGSSASHTRKPSSQQRNASYEVQKPASAGVGQQMNVVQGHQSQQHQPYGIQPSPSPGHAGTPSSLPSINNIINMPQNDGMTKPQESLNHVSAHTDDCAGAGGAAQNGGQPPQSQHQHQQSQFSPPSTDSRVTKGKYSLADFEIQRTLGTGSFGRVHLVQSKHNQRYYAVKVLKKAQVVKMKQVEHTNDERRMLGEVKHPFLITLWGTFQDSRNLYMVMDFVEGGELFSLLRKSGVCLFPMLNTLKYMELIDGSVSRTRWQSSTRPK